MTLADLGPDDTPETPIHLRPGRITWVQHRRHCQQDGPLALAPGERAFSAGPHHGHYSYAIESEGPQQWRIRRCDPGQVELGQKALGP